MTGPTSGWRIGPMLLLAGDLVLGIALTAVECVALVAYWCLEGLKGWAAQGGRAPGSGLRIFLIPTAGPAVLAVVGHGAFEAGLWLTFATQTLLAASLLLLLALGLGTECGRWAARSRERRRRAKDPSGEG